VVVKAFVLELLTGRGPLVPLMALVGTGVLIFLVSARLARHADAIARATGLGGLWIGAVLLAGSTSLPEVLTGLNAAIFDTPDIGVGDLLGAALANMLVLAALDLAFARRRILHQVAVEHTLVGLLAILLTLMGGLAIWTGGWGRVGPVGIETLAIAVVYAGGMRLVRGAGAVSPALGSADTGGARRVGPVGLRKAAGGFALATLGLVAVTPWLVLSADALSRETGLSATFVGALLVGLTTTCPEAAATVSAVRLGALDLAVGNVFGSSAFNMVVLLLMDVVSVRGPILTVVSRDHLLTVLLAVTCLALGVMAILSRSQHRPGLVRIESALIVTTYFLGAWALASHGAP
jgi:cation:H+ antiporter